MKKWILFLWLPLGFTGVRAQIGGEMDYQSLGGFNYRITMKLIVKMDSLCNDIDPTVKINRALYVTDNYDPENVSTYFLQQDSSLQLYQTNDPCIVPHQIPCYREIFYHKDILLPLNIFGYTIANESCCRADSNLNIPPVYPGTSIPEFSQSSNTIALLLHIPGSKALTINQSTDNSPVFNHDSLYNFCSNIPFQLYYAATDPDGDSLVYDFAAAHNYQVTLPPKGAPPPVPPPTPPPPPPPIPVIKPPYPPASYIAPYSGVQPLGPDVKIDRHTGMIHGTMKTPGTYLVAVRSLEYRNGKLIGQNIREFEIAIYNCQLLSKPKAVISWPFNTCNSYTINFIDSSTVSCIYRWDFGDGSSLTGNTMKEYLPEHTYQDTGIFKVRLIVNPGYYCADTDFTTARVFPMLRPAFQFTDSCIKQPVNFINHTTTDYGSINYQHWTFGNWLDPGDSSDQSNPAYQYSRADTFYKVTLTVGTDKGCLATTERYVYLYAPPPTLYTHDTILTHGQIFQLHAPNYFETKYSWYPADGLDNPFIQNPVVKWNKDIVYYVKMETSQGCIRNDSIKVRYFNGPDIYVPNAFTPNGDGKNDIFRPIPVGMTRIFFFRIFNRYGQMVFSTTQYLKGWNGLVNGQAAPIGTYVWEIKGEDFNNHPIFKRGTVLLLR